MHIYNNKYNNKKIINNLIKFLIFILFSIIYLPHALILNEDINLLTAFEVDPGSLLQSIKNLFRAPYYNMNNSYHSSQYGWTWLSINFFLILPVKFFFYLFDYNNEVAINYLIKIIFHFINFISILVLFRLNQKILKYDNIFLAFSVTILYLFNTFEGLFYFLKPETTGILFFLLSVIFLVDYNQKSKNKHFYLSFIFLILSVLTKHLFLFNAIIFSFFLFHEFIKKNDLNFYSIESTKLIFNKFIKIIILFLIIFFLVNPYAFFQPISFLKAQYILSTIFYSKLSYANALLDWINIFYTTSYLLIPFVLNILSLFIYIFLKKKKSFNFFLSLALFTSCIFTLLIVPISNKVLITVPYLVGLLPISFLQIILFLKLVMTSKNLIKKMILITYSFLFLFIIIFNNKIIVEKSKIRLNYKNSVQYKLFIYSKENFELHEKIVVDHTAGSISKSYNKNICHYWRACNTYDKIISFDPDYVIFKDKIDEWSWSDNSEGKNLRQYVENTNMVLFKTITSEDFQNKKILLFKKNIN